MKLSVATWNMANWSHKQYAREAWEYLISELGCDVFLFQESKPDLAILDEKQLVWSEIGGSRPWGSGVYCPKYKIADYPFNNNFKGAVTAAEIEIKPDFKLIVISLYALLETINNTTYSIPNLHRMFFDLTCILENKDTRDRVVIGGDFNAGLQFDAQQKSNSHRVFLDRLKEFGLHNCYEGFYTDVVQTHRHSKSNLPWQIDYFFISEQLRKNLVSCKVINNDKIQKYSDHNPVVIELNF